MTRTRIFALALLAFWLGFGAPTRAADTGVIADGREALAWWIERAETGTPDMQYGLAQMYANGNPVLGMSRNEREAAAWLRRAAERGHARAQYELGLAYEEGRGVAKNRAEAIAWYGKAAEQGHVRAREKFADARSLAEAPAPGARVAVAVVAPAPATGAARAATGEFWPWWQGAAVLAFIAVGFWRINNAPLGVSSSWDRIVNWREEEENARAERLMRERKAQLSDAMLAETIAQFGREAVAHLLSNRPADATAPTSAEAAGHRVPWPAHVTFLAMMAIGGMTATVLGGDFRIQFDLGADHARIFGAGPHVWLLLVAGGFLVGFGTRMAGGCTSGHGLSGCARLQPGSLVATTSFFGAAVVTSLLLEVLK